MRPLTIRTARAFNQLLLPARYKAIWGGRGGGKSHFFGEAVVEHMLLNRGAFIVCVREVQKTLAQSSKRLIEHKLADLGVGKHFKVFHDKIEGPGDGLITFVGMTDVTAESIKSLEGATIAWIEEAQTLSHRSLALLRPTIREEGSELWFSWNPRRRTDAVDEFFRSKQPPNAVVLRVLWSDNPFFPKTLNEERLNDLKLFPERYDHVWNGGYSKITEGAYFASELAKARDEGRIGKVAQDPLLAPRAYWDIGGSGDRADAMAIWIAQFIDQEIRLIDYIEGQGQVLGYYTSELRARGYDRCECYLPHDGVNSNVVTGLRFADHLREAGFPVTVIRNMGKGAATQRIEAVRRLLPKCSFNEATTSAGLEALGAYHEKKDEQREIGLGPEHDWSSHAADAFGLMCIAYRDPRELAAFHRKILDYPRMGIA